MEIFNFRNKNSFFQKNISTEQAKDSGMALVLICLLVGCIFQKQFMISIGIIILVINMIKPDIYLPFAKVWIGLSQVISKIMSVIILAIIFFVVVTPMGILIKIFSIDPMQLKKWKNGTYSVFKLKNQKMTSEDISKPY